MGHCVGHRSIAVAAAISIKAAEASVISYNFSFVFSSSPPSVGRTNEPLLTPRAARLTLMTGKMALTSEPTGLGE
jgi:hypothetical protein